MIAQTPRGGVLAVLKNPYLFATLALLCWSSNWLLGRAMRTEVTPVSLTFWRWRMAVAMLLPFTAGDLWRQRAVILSEWKMLLALSVTGIGFFHTLVYQALQQTTAVNASLVNSATPIAIVAISWLLYRDRATWRQLVGIAVSLLGVLAIISRGDPGTLASFTFNPGDLWALLSVAVISLYNVLLPRRPRALGPMTLLTVTALIALAYLLPFYLWEAATGPTMQFSRNTVILTLYMGFVPSVLAYAFWIPAVAALGANRVGIFSHLHPFFTTVLAILVLGEAVRSYHAAGIALILGGIWLATARRLIPAWLLPGRLNGRSEAAVDGGPASPSGA